MARTPSASAHAKVIDSATKLFAERGIEGTSMDAIAESSGVSKATIYKHWADKDALLLEVMEDLIGITKRPSFDSGNLRADVLAVLVYRIAEENEWRSRIMPHFIAYSAKNEAFGMLWRQRAMDPPRRDLRRLLKAGMKSGELAKLDVELASTLLLGPMLYWHVLLRRTQADPEPLAELVVDAFWRAFAL